MTAAAAAVAAVLGEGEVGPCGEAVVVDSAFGTVPWGMTTSFSVAAAAVAECTMAFSVAVVAVFAAAAASQRAVPPGVAAPAAVDNVIAGFGAVVVVVVAGGLSSRNYQRPSPAAGQF